MQVAAGPLACRTASRRGPSVRRPASASGYDYCYLNLLTIFRAWYSPGQLSSIAVSCLRNYLYSGEEFHAYCLAARGKRPWNAEMQALDTATHLTARARSTLNSLLAKGSVIVCGFHWGAYRFIPVGLGALGYPVTSVLSPAASDKYARYSSYTGAQATEARARGVSEAFYRVKVVDTHRRPELMDCIRSAKRAPASLFFPVDGMFTAAALPVMWRFPLPDIPCACDRTRRAWRPACKSARGRLRFARESHRNHARRGGRHRTRFRTGLRGGSDPAYVRTAPRTD